MDRGRAARRRARGWCGASCPRFAGGADQRRFEHGGWRLPDLQLEPGRERHGERARGARARGRGRSRERPGGAAPAGGGGRELVDTGGNRLPRPRTRLRLARARRRHRREGRERVVLAALLPGGERAERRGGRRRSRPARALAREPGIRRQRERHRRSGRGRAGRSPRTGEGGRRESARAAGRRRLGDPWRDARHQRRGLRRLRRQPFRPGCRPRRPQRDGGSGSRPRRRGAGRGGYAVHSGGDRPPVGLAADLRRPELRRRGDDAPGRRRRGRHGDDRDRLDTPGERPRGLRRRHRRRQRRRHHRRHRRHRPVRRRHAPAPSPSRPASAAAARRRRSRAAITTTSGSPGSGAPDCGPEPAQAAAARSVATRRRPWQSTASREQLDQGPALCGLATATSGEGSGVFGSHLVGRLGVSGEALRDHRHQLGRLRQGRLDGRPGRRRGDHVDHRHHLRSPGRASRRAGLASTAPPRLRDWRATSPATSPSPARSRRAAARSRSTTRSIPRTSTSTTPSSSRRT